MGQREWSEGGKDVNVSGYQMSVRSVFSSFALVLLIMRLLSLNDLAGDPRWPGSWIKPQSRHAPGGWSASSVGQSVAELRPPEREVVIDGLSLYLLYFGASVRISAELISALQVVVAIS